MNEFSKIDKLGVNFFECDEHDFFLQCVGYNNFHYVTPIRKLHMKPVYTLHFILNGSGTLNIDGHKYKLKKHDIFFIPPAVNVSYYPDKNDPWSYVWFEFLGNNSELYAGKMRLTREKATAECQNPFEVERVLYSFLHRLAEGEEIGYYSALSLFYRIVDLYSKETDSDTPLSERILSYLNCHFHNSYLRVEDICKDFGISHSGLCKIFKDDVGRTVKQVLVEIRIEQAKLLLKNSDLSVEEVCFSTGFSDNAHFMKTFKKYVGVPAAQYRRQA